MRNVRSGRAIKLSIHLDLLNFVKSMDRLETVSKPISSEVGAARYKWISPVSYYASTLDFPTPVRTVTHIFFSLPLRSQAAKICLLICPWKIRDACAEEEVTEVIFFSGLKDVPSPQIHMQITKVNILIFEAIDYGGSNTEQPKTNTQNVSFINLLWHLESLRD